MGKPSFSKLALVAFMTIPAATIFTAHAEDDTFQSTVEKFQAESNYGPDVAVMNDAFDRSGKLELSAGGTYSPFSSLITNYSLTGALDYHFSQRHSIEPIWFAQQHSSLGPFAKRELRDNSNVSDADKASHSLEVPKQTFAASYFFNPYYSKMHITERTVTHFDVMLGFGGGVVRTQNLQLTGVTRTAGQNRPALALTAGIRFLLPSRFGLRAELRDFVYQASNLGKNSINHSMQISLSGSIFFGSFPD